MKNSWSLSQGEINCLEKKDNKLIYALKMRYFDLQGYFPKKATDIPPAVIDYVATQLGISVNTVTSYDWQSRGAQLHNSEIREYYGFRKLTQSDLPLIQELIETDLLPQGLSIGRVSDEVYRFLKKTKLDPFAHGELSRYISNICTGYETKFFNECEQHLSPDSQQQLDRLLEKYDDDQTILNFIRTSVGKASTTTITEEQKKLNYIEQASVLYQAFFDNMPRKLLKAHHDRVAISTPSRLLTVKDADSGKYYGLLACFCKYKGAKILDNFVEILVKKLKKLAQHGKVKINEELWEYYTREDKEELLDSLVDISLAHPDGIIKEKIYPEVGGKEKLEQSKLSRQSFKRERRASEYKYLRSLYVHGYRKDIFLILGKLRLRANSGNQILEAINFILKYQNDNAHKEEYYPAACGVITKGLISALDLKVMRNSEGRINRLYYEIAILGLLKKELRCKNIWAQSAFKYCDPERDLPAASKKSTSLYCGMLNISEDPQQEVLTLKRNMLKALQEFNTGIVNDPDVRIGTKAKKPHIYLTPYVAQDPPVNIELLKDEVACLWPETGLLDILKETDLRVGLTSELIEIGGKATLDDKLLQRRLLLSLFAIATNTEFSKVCSGISSITGDDLRYVKKRFITPESLKYIIRKLVNSTIAIRDKQVWGEIVNSFASDSTKFAVWSENLMSEYHIRYQGYGIMAYWHVDKKALCISSQIIKCGASEIAAMLAGIIHHATNAKVDKHSTDTHGQSLVAFAFAYLLGIDLRPRIKGIGRLKLYKADGNVAQSNYSNLTEVMTRPINWQIIIENYDQIIRYVSALKLGTAEVEVLLKRFISDNIQSPVYKAILELGRAVRTIYVCRYLSSKELRMEVEEALSVIENWNSGNNFVFFGKRGVISSNDEVDQELSILCLHLLQSSLVYINTLMLQQVLKTPEWEDRLTLEDKRALTPLFHKHINQYGLFRLDMSERIKIEEKIYGRK